MNDCNISDVLFHLTGWIPQELQMADISSFQGIFERLSVNMEEGNTLIMFSRNTEKDKEYALLKKINLKEGIITFETCNCKFTIPEMFFDKKEENLSMKIENFIEMFDSIHLNWNPTIYDYVIHRECEIINDNVNKFSVMIPPSSQDI